MIFFFNFRFSPAQFFSETQLHLILVVAQEHFISRLRNWKCPGPRLLVTARPEEKVGNAKSFQKEK